MVVQPEPGWVQANHPNWLNQHSNWATHSEPNDHRAVMRTENEGSANSRAVQASNQSNRVNETAAINQRNEANRNEQASRMQQQNEANRNEQASRMQQQNEANRNEQASR